MDINLLVLSVGNTRVALGVFVAGELQYSTRLTHEQCADWPGKIADAWQRISGSDDAAVVAASVNPAASEAIERTVLQTTGHKPQWVGRDIDLPINVLTEQPDETGVDRVLNVAAAHEQMGKACVVVDAGTAITVDCCNDDGDFLGGAIAAGASLQLQALHQHTARLPLVELDVPNGPIGRSTRGAIQHGVYHGIRGMVKELVENYATMLGVWPDIIATGGDAKKLFEGWELIHAIAPDLTLYGIALAFVKHQIKHET